MITNLIFDLSGYGGSANFTATTTTDLINELNTLTGVTWYWDPADCKPKSNFYPVVPPVITTKYKVSFVDIDGDSTGFCNAGSLDFTKFNEIDLTAYGGSANTAVANNTDIVNAFAALSLTVSVSGCDLIIDNWNHVSTPTNVEVNTATSGCVVNSIENGNLILNLEDNVFNNFGWSVLNGINVDSSGITVDWGDGTSDTYTNLPTNPSHVYNNGAYIVTVSYTTLSGDPVTFTFHVSYSSPNWVTIHPSYGNSIGSLSLDTITLNTNDCNNVLLSTSINNIEMNADGFDFNVAITLNGITTTVFSPCGTIPCNASISNINVGNLTIPNSYPLLIEIIHNNVVTATYQVILNLS